MPAQHQLRPKSAKQHEDPARARAFAMKAMLKQRPWSALVPKRNPAMQSPDEAQSATLPSGHEVTELVRL